jgi:hypothetical protein
MLELRFTYGLDYVFVIATTYNEWVIYWLSDTDEMAAATTDLDKIKHSAVDYSTVDKLQLYGTKTYKFNDLQLIKVLLSLSKKIVHSNCKSSNLLIDHTRKYRKIGATDTFEWSVLPKSNFVVTYSMPAVNSQYFFLLQVICINFRITTEGEMVECG